uniref:Zinc finger protein 624-like n=1 Tax=Kryptolebias marmoratus TaxID=37003 RepID=A0A3Q3AKP1_KRYMA
MNFFISFVCCSLLEPGSTFEVLISSVVSKHWKRCSPTQMVADLVFVQDLVDNSEKVKVCPICCRVLHQSRDLKKHLRSHSEERPFVCVTCEKGFKYKDTIKKHQTLKGHEGIRVEQCKKLEQMFAGVTPQTLVDTDELEKEENSEAPAETSKEGPFAPVPSITNKNLKVCPVCSKTFVRFKTLNQHIQCHTVDWPYHCIHCERRFKHIDGLKRHHLYMPVWCSNCGKYFQETSNCLTVHQRKHTGEKPFLCWQCGKCYRSASELTVHMGTHSEDRPWACTQCDMAYRTKMQLRNHVEQVHIGVRYPCTTCGKQFMKEMSLKRHELLHTGERPFPCKVCDKRFLTGNELLRHSRYHTGERPYKCERCNKAFIQSSYLKIHMRLHTGEKPYKCDLCDKSFRLSNSLVKHRHTHTRKTKDFVCNLMEPVCSFTNL